MTAERTPEALMRECITLAREAKANGETAVGALVHQGESIISRGREQSAAKMDPTAHAEIVAIRAAIDALGTTDLGDSGLVTTVEPCAMCAYVLRETGVQSVIWGVDAGEVGGVRGRHRVLTDSEMSRWGDPPERRGGVLEMKCCRVLEE